VRIMNLQAQLAAHALSPRAHRAEKEKRNDSQEP